jgi:hypothetical protein
MISTAPSRNEHALLEIVAANDARATRRNRRIIVRRYGGPDLMTVIEEPLPDPGPGEVRVRILVAGVGYPDVLIREGTYPGGPKPPFTPGYEFPVSKFLSAMRGHGRNKMRRLRVCRGKRYDLLTAILPSWTRDRRRNAPTRPRRWSLSFATLIRADELTLGARW